MYTLDAAYFVISVDLFFSFHQIEFAPIDVVAGIHTVFKICKPCHAGLKLRVCNENLIFLFLN